MHGYLHSQTKNLPQKTEISSSLPLRFWDTTRFVEKLSYIAYEGSTLTLLGILKYDTKLQSFTLSSVSAMIAGGAEECLKFVDEQIRDLRAAKAATIFGATVAVMIGAHIIKNLYQRLRKYRDLKSEERYFQGEINPIPDDLAEERGTFCVVCLSSPSNIIVLPCMHLGLCVACFQSIRK